MHQRNLRYRGSLHMRHLTEAVLARRFGEPLTPLPFLGENNFLPGDPWGFLADLGERALSFLTELGERVFLSLLPTPLFFALRGVGEPSLRLRP